MESSLSPEDDKFLQSLKKLTLVAKEHQKQLEESEFSQKSFEIDIYYFSERRDEPECDDEDADDEKPVVIPPEQQIEPAERVEPAKSSIPPEYVKKVVRELDSMSTQMLKQALARIKVSEV